MQNKRPLSNALKQALCAVESMEMSVIKRKTALPMILLTQPAILFQLAAVME